MVQFDILNRLGVNHKCDRHTDGRTFLAISQNVRSVDKMLCPASKVINIQTFATLLTPNVYVSHSSSQFSATCWHDYFLYQFRALNLINLF